MSWYVKHLVSKHGRGAQDRRAGLSAAQVESGAFPVPLSERRITTPRKPLRGKPQKQRKGVSPISGTAPPKEHQFREGESGNPGGLPKGYVRQDAILRRLGQMSVSELENYRPHNGHEQMAWNQLMQAMDASKETIGFLTSAQDRMDGKPRQSSETTVINENPVDRTPQNKLERLMQTARDLTEQGIAIPAELEKAIEEATNAE